MPIRRNKSIDAGALASELGDAVEDRQARIEAAEADYAARRGSVIERGAQRANDLLRLEQEARDERVAIENVITKA